VSRLFCIIASLTYLFTEELLVDNIYGSSINNTYKLKCLLEGLKCYKDTQIIAYDITKCIAELKATTYSTEIKYITSLIVLT